MDAQVARDNVAGPTLSLPGGTGWYSCKKLTQVAAFNFIVIDFSRFMDAT